MVQKYHCAGEMIVSCLHSKSKISVNMTRLLLYSALVILPGLIEKNELIGRWESKPSEKGNVTGVVFKDSTFEGYVNKKPFVSGAYKLENDIFSFVDNGCE